MLTGLMYALLAGLFGAFASSSAKLSLGASYLKELCDTAVGKWAAEEGSDADTTACEWVIKGHVSLQETQQCIWN